MIIASRSKTARTSSLQAAARFLVVAAALLCAAVVFNVPSFANSARNSTAETVQTLETQSGKVVVKWIIDPERNASFEPFSLSAEIRKPKSISVAPDDLAGRYGDFDVEYLGDEKDARNDSTEAMTRRWALYPTKRGELVLPPIPLAFEEPSSQKKIRATLPTRTLLVERSDVAVPSVDDISPRLEPIRRITTLEILLFVLTAVVFVFVIRAFFAREKKAVASSGATDLSPFDRAIVKLDKLKNSRFYLESNREFYVELDSILREYVAGVSRVNALERTTREIVEQLSTPMPTLKASASQQPTGERLTLEPSASEKEQIADAVLQEPEIIPFLRETLESLDLIKFAKKSTVFNDASRLYDEVRRIVELSQDRIMKRLEAMREERVRRANVKTSKEDADARD